MDCKFMHMLSMPVFRCCAEMHGQQERNKAENVWSFF